MRQRTILACAMAAFLGLSLSGVLTRRGNDSSVATASINCPASLTATKGTIDMINAWSGYGADVRQQALIIRGTVNSSGAFECTVPYMNGLLRLYAVREISGMGSATVDMDAMWDADYLVIPAIAQATMSGSPNQATAQVSSDTMTTSTTNGLACPLKIKINSATAGGKFVLLIVLRLGI